MSDAKLNQKINRGNPNDVVSRDDENISRALSIEERNAEVTARAVDIFDNGQTQPVRCFVGKGGKPHVYIGHTRTAAVSLIRKGFQVPTGETETVPVVGGEEGQTEERPIFRTIHNPDFPLDYVVDDLTAEEAAVRSVADNFQNNKPNDLDLAAAAKALQDRFNYTDAKVTQLLGVSDPFKIGRVKKLLTAPKYLQEAVQAGTLATATALEVVAAKGEARTKANDFVKKALESGKAPTQSQVKATIRAAESPSNGGDKQKAPTGTEIRNFLKALSTELEGIVSSEDNPEGITLQYANVVSAFNRFVHGDISEKTLTKKLDEYFGVQKAPKKSKTAKKDRASKEADPTPAETVETVEAGS